MGFEDFTGYIEQDANNSLTETTTRCTATGVVRTYLAYLYKDKLAGHFGNFEFKLDVCFTSAPTSESNYIWACVLANALGGYNDLSTLQGVAFRRRTVVPYYILTLWDKLVSSVESSVALTLGTTYYLRFQRSGTTLTLKIYSTSALRDAGGTADIDTLTINNCTTTTWQYVYGMMSWHYTSGTSALSAYTENLDLQEVVIVPPTITTQSGSGIGTTYAILNGNITNKGGENCDQRGFDWGIQTGVYPYNWTENGSFVEGAFSHQITALDPNKTYYYRAKAHNSAGWGYGNEVSFTTLVDLPTVTTQDATNIEKY